MLRCKVASSEAPQLSKLLFARGATGLVESDASSDGVLALDCSFDPSCDLETLVRTLRERCEHDGVRVEFCLIEIDDSWKLQWIDHLQPVVVSPSLRLVPAQAPPQREPDTLYLQPALAFGFGEHPTTLMALGWLQARCPGRRVLDMGSGTGVLSLAAAHWGATGVLGVDIDRASVEASRANAVANGLDDACHFALPSDDAGDADFDVVVANIDAITLCQLAQSLCARLAPGGLLAITGILQEQERAVQAAFESCGVRPERVDARADWVLLATTSG